MTDRTARFTLPLIDPGQSQKEMTHNEALSLVDAALQPSVRGVGVAVAPASPAVGDQWIVAPVPSGDWAMHPGAIATWTEGGWRFLAPVAGMAAWSIPDRLPLRYNGGEWVLGDVAATRLVVDGLKVVGARRGAVAVPSGGMVIDTEARAAIAALVATLTGHGLIAEH